MAWEKISTVQNDIILERTTELLHFLMVLVAHGFLD